MPLFILFLVVPLIELYLLIQVGQVIGALATIALCILTAAIGAALLKQQGLQTLSRARANVDRGAVPAIELFEGVALAAGGLLLLTPGLITDVLGFACLLPFTRHWIVSAVMKRVHVTYGPAGGRGRNAGKGGAIEGEYQRRDHDEH